MAAANEEKNSWEKNGKNFNSEKKLVTCNHQKSHSECQGGKQLCVFIQCTEKKITCDRKVNLLRRVWKKLITSVPFNLLNKSLFISDLIIDSIF